MGTDDLIEYEIAVLEQIAGLRDDLPWGGAMGEAIEALQGHGLVMPRGRALAVTNGGRAFLAQRRTTRPAEGDADG